jgi:hypothetical protein
MTNVLPFPRPSDAKHQRAVEALVDLISQLARRHAAIEHVRALRHEIERIERNLTMPS